MRPDSCEQQRRGLAKVAGLRATDPPYPLLEYLPRLTDRAGSQDQPIDRMRISSASSRPNEKELENLLSCQQP